MKRLLGGLVALAVVKSPVSPVWGETIDGKLTVSTINDITLYDNKYCDATDLGSNFQIIVYNNGRDRISGKYTTKFCITKRFRKF